MPGGNVKAPATRMRQALTFGQIRRRSDAKLLRYAFAPSVDCRTHEFTDLPSIVEYGTKNRVDVLQPCAGTHHAVIESITFLLNQCFQVPLNLSAGDPPGGLARASTGARVDPLAGQLQEFGTARQTNDSSLLGQE